MENKIIHGDSLIELQKLEENSVDTIITDPPYGLSFMGKKWDYDVPSVELWKEALRVLKPGGTALIFAGSRTQHRMAVNVEDAGLELKDCIMWLYGSGFPKATDISKQLDKLNGRDLDIYKEIGRHIKQKREDKGISLNEMNKSFGYVAGCNWWESQNDGNVRLINLEDWHKLKTIIDVDDKWTNVIERVEAEREVIGKKDYTNSAKHSVPGEDHTERVHLDITKAKTPEAQQWEGWKSHGLKPAYEPILVAVKPNNGTYANNALKHGVAGLNIEGGRVGERFPTNIILDEEAGEMLGEPQRFFYCAKASKAERGDGNYHPTVKPMKLMEYLCTLTKTPTGGTVLDPFAGSGTTLLAAKNTGREYIGIEREEEYIDIINARLK